MDDELSALDTASNAKLNAIVADEETNKDGLSMPNEPQDDMNDEYYKKTTNEVSDDDESSTVTSGPTKVELLMRVLESRMSCDHLNLAENPAALLLLQQVCRPMLSPPPPPPPRSRPAARGRRH